MINKALFSSNSDEWETPRRIFEELNAEFNFNLDPCATDQNHKCKKYFTAEQNGLEQMWGGTEYFATRHIQKLLYGSKRHSGKQEQTTRLLCC